jgi:hypothetical protein
MKRIILMLTVAAFMVAAMAITSTGAFAAQSSGDCTSSTDNGCTGSSKQPGNNSGGATFDKTIRGSGTDVNNPHNTCANPGGVCHGQGL